MSKNNCGCNSGRGKIEANKYCSPKKEECHDNCGGSLKPCCTPSVGPRVPYYANVSMCPEDNKKYQYVERISQVFKTAQSFCMPDCGARIRVVFDGISDVAVGAWMWAYGIGFLEVVGFNPFTSEIELENPCPSDPCQAQVPPGTPIPACTVFIVTVPPCPSATSGTANLYPYLASGFTAPTNGSCIDITVTNVNGLSVNKNITINTGIYRISEIKSATIITICNDGDGLPPGTNVQFQDANGNFIVPIVLLDSNPCLNDDVTAGIPLVCNGGVQQPLVGTETGQVLVYDHASGLSNYRTLGIPTLDCTTLTVCLTLDPALPPGTAYLVQVADTSNFSPTDVLLILGTQFVVDSIVNSTQMYLVPVVTPSAIQTYPPGSTVCGADCCQALEVELAGKANNGVNTDITRLDGLPLTTWSPIPTLNGGASIGSIVQAGSNWCRIGAYIEFQMAVRFTVSNVSSSSTLYSVPAPVISGISMNAETSFIMHIDDDSDEVPGFWRYTGGVIVCFQALNASFSDGTGRLMIDGKYRIY